MRNLTAKPPVGVLFITLLSCLCLLSSVSGQTPEENQPVSVQSESQVTSEPSDYVSIQVDGGTIRDVLNAFAIQTGRNVVIGPEVTSEGVNIHLNQVLWDEALEVVLKPYGYGYRTVGDTIVISKLENLAALASVEPIESRVYQLLYLDASDVLEIINGQLSPRGTSTIITARGQKGWKDLTARHANTKGSGTTLEMREREEDDQIRGKMIVVSDIPSVHDNVAETLRKIDTMPEQVLIEARIMEVNKDLLRDIGVEINATISARGQDVNVGEFFFDAEPNSFGQLSEDVTGKWPLTTYGYLSASAPDWSLFISMLEEDEDTKTLSAPKVLTINNQEAAIVVGTRYPIIESEFNTGISADSSDIKSESLEYYESIGIQLNVVPQICADNHVKMVVRPSVTEIIGFEGINNYPVIKTRDTETQVLVANGETIAIGGLLEDRKTDGVFKVPFLGDIPILGRLFRRDTKDTKTIDLLIFISATIINEANYSHIVADEEELTFDEPDSEPEKPILEPTAETEDLFESPATEAEPQEEPAEPVVEAEPVKATAPTAEAEPESPAEVPAILAALSEE